MTTKTTSMNHLKTVKPDVKRLVNFMTAVAWFILGIGVLLSLINLSHFSDQNTGLMVGIGFLIGSVHIYVIGTAIGLVHARMVQHAESKNASLPEEEPIS
ncbi:hypothetical protein A7K91_08870 [Paenibacillus oryzae]|jgi:hypothetical protein|uniref:Uncharacterized protein n=1 Tax=Paenibacillus oryzae TaxID=1844972 RepID=A0A1A5YQC9_9BACL|nr:hypothetical protein [Paenibacillus oryzae]OBR67826.1 hypothetical protein A7K91_08870 [Paenibacillus oryzae]